jgi:hypothetical protein
MLRQYGDGAVLKSVHSKRFGIPALTVAKVEDVCRHATDGIPNIVAATFAVIRSTVRSVFFREDPVVDWDTFLALAETKFHKHQGR